MKKLLIIEDEHSLREDIVEILEFENYKTLSTENGLEGVELAREHLPDLIICDIMLPNLDGYDVLLEIRSDLRTAHIPFIFMTAKNTRTDIRRGMELGADDYLTKPFTPSELVAAVNTRLQKHQTLTEAYEEQLQTLRQNVISALPHEIRTPLTGIMGYALMLIEEANTLESTQVVHMSKRIYQAAQRIHHLTENYLQYAQIEILLADPNRVQEVQQQQLEDIEEVLRGLINQQAQRAERTADLHCHVDNADLQISFESLEKIVSEVLDNAFKFSEPGTPITVRTQIHEDMYRLLVTDTGRGMSQEQIASIGAYMQFERRLYEQMGTGLGLIIAKRLAELHQGGLVIESIPKQETTVTISIPLAHKHSPS